MNKNSEFEKSYDRFHKHDAIKEWWNKHSQKILRVVLFPLYFTELIADKIKKHNADKNAWSEDKAKDFCDKYLPLFCDKTDNGFWFYNNGYGFTCRKQIRRRPAVRRFASEYKRHLFCYICDTYEIEGYTKHVLTDTWDSVEVEWIRHGMEENL